VERFEDQASAPGLGMVRAKTGTLTGVNALAGTVTDLDGDVMTLVLMADQVAPARTLAARQALDDAAAALASCHCAVSSG
jgi:D-alanyl-D-alanine carboxypeptidase/D-alanyl-D-alanine-endopeptidase (penicillin-binding protein 4)